MSESIIDAIQNELNHIAESRQVTILYACESGSRAWGFESMDSDYDVRFIYLKSTRSYLTIQDRRDVIERPVDPVLDISGWDLPKALKLLRKSNPPLLEWLQSPIIYREHPLLRQKLLPILPCYYSPIACSYHYLRMAQNNYRDYLKNDIVRPKKYFYVLRPVLACLWIERSLGPVPTEFIKLVNALIEDPELRCEIDQLIEHKRSGDELDSGPRIPAISDFLEYQLERLQADHQPSQQTRDSTQLDNIFNDLLLEINGPTIL